jgi:hypothetical protein
VILRNLCFQRRENVPHHQCLKAEYIYIFQAWHRELLLKDKWDNDMKIFDLEPVWLATFALSTRRIRLQLCLHQPYP